MLDLDWPFRPSTPSTAPLQVSLIRLALAVGIPPQPFADYYPPQAHNGPIASLKTKPVQTENGPEKAQDATISNRTHLTRLSSRICKITSTESGIHSQKIPHIPFKMRNLPI